MRLMSLCIRRIFFESISEVLTAFFVNVVALTIILSIAILLPVMYVQNVMPVVTADYDYRIQLMKASSLDKLEDKGTVARAFKVGTGGGTFLSCGDNNLDCDVDVCDSFENKDLGYFADAMLLGSLPSDQLDERSIAITVYTAQSLSVGLGSEICVDGELPFTVGWIYESASEPGAAGVQRALICDSAYLEAWSKTDFEWLNSVYVQIGDSNAFQEAAAQSLSSEDDKWGSYCSSRKEDVTSLQSGQFSLLLVFFVSFAAICALAFFIIRSAASITAQRAQDYITIYRLGVGKRGMTALIGVDRLLCLVPPFAVAMVVSKIFVFTWLTALRFSWKLMLMLAACCFIFILFDIAVAAVVNANKVARRA